MATGNQAITVSGNEILKVKGRFGAELLLNAAAGASGDGVSAASCYSLEDAERAYARISSWPAYVATPLHALPAAAEALGLGTLWCKDESRRLGLASFKALGAVFAAVSVVSRLLEERLGRSIDDRDLLAGRHAADLSDIYLTCCTDGNHGFSVANAARRMGCRAAIYIPSGVSAAREAALRREGAEVVRVNGTYDEAYALVESVARDDPGAVLVSDSATPEYRDIPALCMTGYSVMAREVIDQLQGEVPTHVMLPAGCGGMAAAMISAFDQLLGSSAPQPIIVEPLTADCVFASLRTGAPTVVEGDLETIMGGLSCAAVSHVAWPTISAGAKAIVRMQDEAAVEAMRFLADPVGNDSPIVSGETGAAGLAGLLALREDDEARALLGLDQSARVLVINCEGATDADAYRNLVGAERASELGVSV